VVVHEYFAFSAAVAQSAHIEYHSDRLGRLVWSRLQVYSTIFKTLSQKHKRASIMAKIMVVEDDEQALAFMAEVLALDGHEAIVVNDASKALEMAGASLPEVFLLDLMMPPPDGFKLCRMLRTDPKFKSTPIIIVTALDDTDSKIVAIGAGANDYIVKPYHMKDLSSKLDALLGD